MYFSPLLFKEGWREATGWLFPARPSVVSVQPRHSLAQLDNVTANLLSVVG